MCFLANLFFSSFIILWIKKEIIMQILKVNQNNNTNPAFQALVLKGFNKNKGADFAVLKALYETPLMRDRFDRDLAKGVDTVLTLTRSAKIDEFTKTHHPRTPYLGKTNLTIQSTKQPEWLLSGMANGADKSDALMNSGYDLAKQVKEFSLDDITDVFDAVKASLKNIYGVKNK